MIKNDKKIKAPVPVGISEQVGAMIENFDSKLGTMIEHFDDKIGLVAEQVGHIAKVVDKHTEILNHHSESIAIIQMNIEFIKAGLKRKVDAEEFVALEHRVSLLESRR